MNVNVFHQLPVFKSESISNKKGIVISVCLGGGGRKKWLRCDFLIFTKRNKNRLKNKVFCDFLIEISSTGIEVSFLFNLLKQQLVGSDAV